MAVTVKVAKVVSSTFMTPTTVEVAFQTTDPMLFNAGQYVVVEVGKTPEGQPLRRSYSISNEPNDGSRFDICVKMVQGGVGSNFLKGLKAGDDVPYLGPLGKFVVGKVPAKEYVFIATGTGLSPCLSILLERLPKDASTPMRLYWGLRNKNDLYYHERILELEKKHPNFKYSVTLSQPGDGWNGCCGRVNTLITSEVKYSDGMEFYMAGNGSMIEDVKKHLIESGAPKTAIKTDVFF